MISYIQACFSLQRLKSYRYVIIQNEFASSESFAPVEFVPFGATGTAPPDLKAFTAKISSKLQTKSSGSIISTDSNKVGKVFFL